MAKQKKITKKKRINKRLTVGQIKDYSWKTLSTEKPFTYVATDLKTKKKWLVKRKGVCDYKACGNACCKFTHYDLDKGTESYKFHLNFGEKGKHSGVTFKRDCNKLCKSSGKCNVWNKDLPKACVDFPQPQDSHYWEVFSKCSFYFEKSHILKDLK